jgi:hypothetical protein
MKSGKRLSQETKLKIYGEKDFFSVLSTKSRKYATSKRSSTKPRLLFNPNFGIVRISDGYY